MRLLEISFSDYIDIFLVACILYRLYKDLRGTSAIRLFVGVLIFVICWLVVSFVFQMKLLGAIMDQIVNVGVIALIVLFQDEIRQFFTKLGSRQNFVSRFMKRMLDFNEQKIENDDIMQIVLACKNMAKNKVGALIVIPHNIDLRYIEDTGERIDAKISERLIENIFFKNTPLHDGAMIISNGKIKAASCILPVTHKTDVDPDLGLRHRAALGITEKSDAWAIVVSEETGRISWTEFGNIETGISQEKLEQYLSKMIKNND